MTESTPGTPAMSAGRLVVLDEPALIRALADWVTGAAQRAVAARGRCTVALAGGKTRMSIESIFPDTAAMEQLLAMGMQEGLTLAVGQIDAILAEQPARA